MTNHELDYAVTRLTVKWSDVLAPLEAGDHYTTVEYDPLLDMLQTAVRSSLGRTASGPGSSSDRNVIDLKAFDLLERIDGIVKSWVRELGAPRQDNIKVAVVSLATHLETLWSTQNVTESVYLNLSRTMVGWVDDIWSLFNPPVKKELIAPCPECGEEHYFTTEGERQTALIAQYWQGLQPEAQCQRCGARWFGEKELLELGYSIHANVNEDELRQMGVL